MKTEADVVALWNSYADLYATTGDAGVGIAMDALGWVLGFNDAEDILRDGGLNE